MKNSLGNLVGVAKLDIGAGELGALALEGVFEMTRSPRYAFIGCGKVAWSERLRAVVGMTEPGAVPIGHNLRSTRIGDSTMTVRLCQGVRTP